MSSDKRKSEVIKLLTKATIANQFDESYWSADYKVWHECKVFAMGQCKSIKSHYLQNFKPKYDDDSDSDDSTYSLSKIRTPSNYKYSENQLDQIIAALGNCIPFYAHLYTLKGNNHRVHCLCPFSPMMDPWKKRMVLTSFIIVIVVNISL